MNLSFIQNNNKLSELTGWEFDEITNDWKSQKSVEIMYEGEDAELWSYCSFNTFEDKMLSYYLQVEISVIDEVDNVNKRKLVTFNKWKGQGVYLGKIENKDKRIIVFDFSCESLPKEKQGAIAHYDFEFAVKPWKKVVTLEEVLEKDKKESDRYKRK